MNVFKLLAWILLRFFCCSGSGSAKPLPRNGERKSMALVLEAKSAWLVLGFRPVLGWDDNWKN